MSIKVQGQVVINNDKKGLFDQVNPGAYTTAERDALTPSVGDIVYNSEDEELQVWNGVEWGSAGSGSGGIGTPVDVLTPLNGAGVGGANTFTPQTDDITEVNTVLDYGYCPTGTSANDFKGMVYGNGIYVLLTRYDGVKYSTDEGYSWNSASGWPGGNTWNAVCWNGSVFCAVGSASTKVATSPDGNIWTPIGSSPACNFYDVDADPVSGKIVAVGHSTNNDERGIWYSTDNGDSFSYVSIGGYWINDSDLDFDKVAYGGGRWVALVSAHRNTGPAYSTNGTSWTLVQARLSNINHAWKELLYDKDQGRFVAFQSYDNSSSPRIHSYTSYNGSTWTDHQFTFSGSSNGIHEGSIAYGNGVYMFAPYSMDGYYWSRASQGLNSWSYAQYGFYYNQSEDIDKITYVNDRWFFLRSNLLQKRRQLTSYEELPEALNANSGTSYQSAHDKLTLSGTNIYDYADGSLMPDFTLTDVWPTTVGSALSSTSGLAQTVYSVDGNVLTVGAGAQFAVGGTAYANGQITEYGPSPTEVEFTSSNAGTASFSGTDATLAYRTWTLETRASSSDPWTVVTTSDDYSPAASQNGATPWAGKPTLTADTQYRVKVEYSSANAKSVESDYTYFTTGPS